MRLILASFVLCLIYCPVLRAAIFQDSRAILDPNSKVAGYTGLVVNTGHSCTVGIIGQRLAISNKHCFGKINDDGSFEPHRFVVQDSRIRNHGWIWKPQDVEVGPGVVVGIKNTVPNALFEFKEIYWDEHQDMALLVLGENIRPTGPRKFPGQIFKTLRICNLRTEIISRVSMAGFSEDFFNHGPNRGNAHLEHSCPANFNSESSLTHYCSMSKGASGSPIWIDYGAYGCALAVNTSETCPNKAEYRSGTVSCGVEGIQNNGTPLTSFIRQKIKDLESQSL